MAGQPIYILADGSQVTRGRDAQSNNILAGKAVANAVRTTLGPKGMDKMLVDSMGDVVITNDGATILKEMDIEHPTAKMIVEVAKTQEDEVGDGTTTAAVLAGEFLSKAEELLKKGVHPTIIATGYRQASKKAVEIVKGASIDISRDDTEALKKVAKTAITGKGAESHKEMLAELTVEAVSLIGEETDDGYVADVSDIKIEKQAGESVGESKLVKGLVLDKARTHPNMPDKIEDAKILVLSIPVEFKKTEMDAEIKISSPDQMQMFLDQEERMVKQMTDKILNSGANVVFCQKGIDDLAQYYLEKAGVYAAKRLKKSDLDRICEATGATNIQDIDEITADDLGSADLVEERDIKGNKMTYITGCREKKAVSIILHGGTQHVVDSLQHAVDDALHVVAVALEDGKVVVGGGSPEVELSMRLGEYASSLSGREQLAVAKFAEAFEVIPETLAENSGYDPINKLVELRSKHEEGNKRMGLNVYNGEIVDMWENDVIEPLRAKTQAIDAGTEAAVMVLRIDDVVSGSSNSGQAAPEMPDMDMDM
ncbi:thermosome subunit [Methanohalophilus sp. RSK]|uniref:thermosome subunit alpha n=1 Tax=Methanohalophilus sp. RSK TaxID=2485783 RepID=UPI000F43BD33|nr:thermosome subunit alpha [Methanohalophilus sp. RSK]RNI15892.1 thermosome subunit [Methanohalophilus sp. RSK]